LEIDVAETITAAEANRNFSRCLRDVRDGASFVITSHGRPVARLVPIDAKDEAAEAARTRLIAYLRTLPPAHLGTFTRDMAHDDAE
jgi:prevent-host-death family protein